MAIIDFKQTNKVKRKENGLMIIFYNWRAYAMAHNFIYKTQITKGVVMMCSKDNFYQEFVVEGEEFNNIKHKFLGRVDEYYNIKT